MGHEVSFDFRASFDRELGIVASRLPDHRARPVRCIILSKDRPLQLDGTLRSLEWSCADLESADVHVLFKGSTTRFAAGYRVLASQHPKVSMYLEADFKADLIRLVSGSDYVFFVVDDTLFVGELSLTAAVRALDGDPKCLGFSYRLGRNTTYCYSLDKPQRLPAFTTLDSGCLSFDWTAAEHDFAYPIEVSSSMYRTADVLPLIQRLPHGNPNTLEAALSQEASAFRRSHPRLACYEHSVAVSVPANIVQTAWTNRVDGRAALAPDALLRRYEGGERLDVKHYRGLIPNACHQELDLVFQRDPTVPTVSVVIPCYDQAQYLPDAVRSVVAQTFTDWEIVIVDDGSPDDTAEVAGRLRIGFGERIRLVRQSNRGLSAARNAGIVAALGRYILPLDADDRIEPAMLEVGLQVLTSDASIAFVYTDAVHFDEQSERIVHAAEYRFDDLTAVNMPNYCALFRREAWEAAGGYNPNMRWGYEDWDFWLSCGENGYYGQRVAEPLFRYRVRQDSMFASAVAHDRELRLQLRHNHPKTYGWPGRLARAAHRARRGPHWISYRVRRLMS